MNTISIEKQRAISSFCAFLLGDAYPPLAPLELFLEVSNVCNLRCAMCPTFSAVNLHRPAAVKSQQRGYLDIKSCVTSLESILPHVLNVHAFGYGEPTIHPQFKDLIEYLSKFRVMIDFITNGTQLTDELCTFLVKKNVARVTVSFSGSTQADYENIYIGGDFNKVLAGMKRLNLAKQKIGAKYPVLTVNSIAFRHHINHLPDFVDMMADHGVESIEVKKLVENVAHLRGHAAPYRMEEEQILVEAQKRALKRGVHLDAIQYTRESCQTDTEAPPTKLLEMKDIAKGISAKDIDQTHTICDDLDLFSLSKADLGLELNLQPRTSPVFGDAEPFYCLEPFKTMYVRQNGYVKPCCFVADRAAALGNIHTNQARDIWKGTPFMEIRKGVALEQYPVPHCKHCLREGQAPKNNDIPRSLKTFTQWYKACFDEELLLEPVHNHFTKLISLFRKKRMFNRICRISTEEVIAALTLNHPQTFSCDAVQPTLTSEGLTKTINTRRKSGRAIDDLVLGTIDLLNRQEASGWFFVPQLPDFHGTILVCHEKDGKEIARGIAAQDRGDLREAGYGTGSYGFRIPLPRGWDHEESLTPSGLKVIVQELDLDLNDIYRTQKQQASPNLWYNINQFFELGKVEGIWQDNDHEWSWLANESEFTLKALCDGILTFTLIIPDDLMMQQILPMSIQILADGKAILCTTIKKPGHHEIAQKIVANQTVRYRVSCDKFVVPDEYCGNKDTRKLSLIIAHFGVTQG